MSSCGFGFTSLDSFSSCARQASLSGMWMLSLPSWFSMVAMNLEGCAVPSMMV